MMDPAHAWMKDKVTEYVYPIWSTLFNKLVKTELQSDS